MYKTVSNKLDASTRTSSGSQQNNVNACIILLGTHRSARFMRLKSWRLLQESSASCQLFRSQNFIPSMILSSNIMIFYNFIYNASGIFNHGSFTVHALLPGTSKAFILSVFLPGTMAHTLTSFCRAQNIIMTTHGFN